ncbi:MAG: hypothetical protein M1816_006559 [Peltula sp. TS41687]|nr:MAG: hypothetical protein M1816_006559 [Peltula sp. TS41687]
MVKTREANYFDVGVQGRKTGITLKQGQRDEHGLELIDGIFSPVAPAPSRPGNDGGLNNALVGGGGGGGAPENKGTTSTTTTATTTAVVLTDRRLINNTPGRSSNSSLPPPPPPLPPRARSPIKTNLNTSPRRPPSSPTKSRPSSPPYQGLNGTPRRGIPHPSSGTKRKLNGGGENVVRPIVRSSPTVVRRVSPRRLQSTTPLKKESPRKDVGSTGQRRDENQNAYQFSPAFGDAMVDEGDTRDEGVIGLNKDQTEEDVPREEDKMVDSFLPLTRHDVGRNMDEFDDMDDSMQLVQYDDDGRGEQDNPLSTNDHLQSPGDIGFGQDDLESDKEYIPTPGVTRFRRPTTATVKPQAIPHQTSESPAQATTLAIKRGRGRPPKARTLVYQDSDMEYEHGRARKVFRGEQDSSYLSTSGGGGGGGNAFSSNPVPTLRDPNTRLALNENGIPITPQKRGPGRPRKIRFDGSTPVIGGSSSQTVRGDITTDNNNTGPVVKRGRGRPRKSECVVSNNTPVMLTSQPGNQWMDGGGGGVTRENAVVDGEWSNGDRWTSLDNLQDLNVDQRLQQHSEPIDPALLGQSQQRRDIPTNGNTTYQRLGSSSIPPMNQPPPPPPPPPQPSLSVAILSDNPPPPAKRGRGRPKGSKNKPKPGIISQSGQASSSSSRIDALEPWEEDPGIITGAVRLWDTELESSLDYLVEEEIAYSSKALSTFSSVANGSFRFAKALTLDFFGIGIVEIPPGGSKSPRNARKMHMAFGVIRGKVLVECAGTKFRIGEEGVWHVPRG